MRTAISALELRQPSTLDEALRMMRDEKLVPLAGTTDVYVSVNFGTLTAQRFIDLWPLDPLREIAVRGSVLSIGALASYTTIIRSPDVNARLPMLIESARQIGGAQIQNRGTLGGNIANGSPAGDTLPVLAVAEAVLVLRTIDGERRVPFSQFYTGYRASVLRPAIQRDDRHTVEVDRLRSCQLLREKIRQHVRRNSLLFQHQHDGFDLRVLRFDGERDRDFIDDFVGHDAWQVFDGAEPGRITHL